MKSEINYNNIRREIHLTNNEINLIIDNRATKITDNVKQIILLIIAENVGTYKTWLLTGEVGYNRHNFSSFSEQYIPSTPSFISDGVLRALREAGIDVSSDDFKKMLYFGINSALTAMEKIIDNDEQMLYDQVRDRVLR